MVWVDRRYFGNGEGFPTMASISAVDLVGYSISELKDFLDSKNVDYTGVTLKADLLALALLQV